MSSSLPSRWLVSTEWLAAHLRDPDVVVVDASYYLPTQKRDAHAEYRASHIPGAVFFDIEAVADHSTDLPHMLPTETDFAAAAGALGIAESDAIVVYDCTGLFSSARVWWTFRAFGAAKVFILDGGFPKWRAEGRAVESGDVKRAPRTFAARLMASAVAGLADVRRALDGATAQVVDARSRPRFRGDEAEPRAGLPSGHMPGALNVPHSSLIENGRLVSPDRLAKAFADAGVDLDKPVITSCGSGVTAAILWLALDALGREPKGLYDGSWAEWGSRPELPVAMGPK